MLGKSSIHVAVGGIRMTISMHGVRVVHVAVRNVSMGCVQMRRVRMGNIYVSDVAVICITMCRVEMR